MTDDPADALLRDALLLFNDRPNFGLRRDPGFTSYRLAARIDLYLASRSVVDAEGAQAQRAEEHPRPVNAQAGCRTAR